MIKPYYETELGKLYHGDCLEILPQLTERVDLVLTSPPYDNLRDYNGYSLDFHGIANALYESMVVGGVMVWVVGDATVNGSETGTSFKQALYFKEIGFNLHDTMIYLKNQLAFPDDNRYYNAFEYMFVFSKGKPKSFNPIKDRKNVSVGRDVHGNERKKNGELRKNRACAGNIISEYGVRWNYWLIYNQARGIQTQHPAIFPDRLAQDHILSWTNPGDLVIDCFSGSGTTAVACERLGRRWIGIEISKEYCDIAVKRIEQERSQLNLSL